MNTFTGYHGEWNMGSPGGWEYQRICQVLGKEAWHMIRGSVELDLDVDFDHPQINAVPGFAEMWLRAHAQRHGTNPVHAVLLAEVETLDVVLENRNFVEYLNGFDGVRASLAGPGHMSLKGGKICCNGTEATVIFMDFNSDTLVKIGKTEDIRPIKEAIRQGILVNPRGMEPLGAKGLFEALTERFAEDLSPSTVSHTPWTRRFSHRKTTGPKGEPIADLPAWTKENWPRLILKPVHGYSGHGIFPGDRSPNPAQCIDHALKSGDYIVQDFVPLNLWSEQSTGLDSSGESVVLQEWQTDFRCFITDRGLQGFLARFGGVPTNVGSGGGGQPVAVLKTPIPYRQAVDRINEALSKLGYAGYLQIQREMEAQALAMGFTYLRGPIKILIRPRLLTEAHIAELKQYAANLWNDSVALEKRWREGELDEYVLIGEEERALAMMQPWSGGPALMVSDGLFSFGADIRSAEGAGCVAKI
jgi:hypothetical protein